MPDPIDTETQAEQPATEGATSESTQEVVDQQPNEGQISPESETGTNEEGSDTPKDNAAWAKMRTENKRLKEALGSTDPNYLESLRSAVRQPEYQPQVPQTTGDADYTQVTQNLNWASQQAAIARQENARLRNQIELQQDREAERAFPELKDSKGLFHQLVAEKKFIARQLGQDRTTYEIAEEVDRLLGKREEQVAVKAAENTKQQILQRQAISSEPKGTTTSNRPAAGDEELRMRVRRGDTSAQDEVSKRLIADLEF